MTLSNWRTRMVDQVIAAMPRKMASAAATCRICVQPRRPGTGRDRVRVRLHFEVDAGGHEGSRSGLRQAEPPRDVADGLRGGLAAQAAHVSACFAAVASASSSPSINRWSKSVHFMVIVSRLPATASWLRKESTSSCLR